MSVSIKATKAFGPYAGKSFNDTQTILAATAVQGDKGAVPAAVPGVLNTRTDNDTGVVGLTAGHGQTNGVYDVYWAGGHRRGMTGVVTVNDLALDLGAGDNLPVLTTPVTVTKRTLVEARFDGDDLKLIAGYSAGKGVFVFTGDDDVEDYFIYLSGVGSDGWHNKLALANPVAGDVITKCYISNGEVTAKAMRFLAAVGDP